MSRSEQKHAEYELEKNKLQKNAQDTKAQVENKMEQGSDYAKEKYYEGKQKVNEAADKAKEKINEGADYAKQKKYEMEAEMNKPSYAHQGAYSSEYEPRVNVDPNQEAGILQSAKETITSAYNVVATKIQETAEVAKEKFDEYLHPSEHPHVVESSTRPPTVINPEAEKDKNKI